MLLPQYIIGNKKREPIQGKRGARYEEGVTRISVMFLPDRRHSEWEQSKERIR